MLKVSNFFQAIPITNQLASYEYISSKDLYQKCRLLNKQQCLLASLALLSRQDKNALSYQQQLIQDWAYTLPSYLRGVDQDKLLSSTLMKLLEHRLLDCGNKINVLIIVSKFKNNELPNSQNLIHTLQIKLKDSSKTDSFWTILISLRYLSPILSETNRIDFITLIQDELMNFGPMLQEYSMDCLAYIATHLPTPRLDEFSESIEIRVNDSNLNRSLAAIKCLSILAPKLSEERLNALAITIKAQINHPNWKIQKTAIKCLTGMASKLSKDVLISLYDPLEAATYLASMDTSAYNSRLGINQTAIKCLSVISRRVPQEHLSSFAMGLQTKMNTLNWDRHTSAKKCLKAIIPQLNEETLESLALPFKDDINSVDSNIRATAVEFLTLMANDLSETTLNSLVPRIKEKINDADERVSTKAIEFLSKINTTLPKEDLSTLAVIIIAQINDYNDLICPAAIQFLITIPSRLYENSLYEFLTSKLNAPPSTARKTAIQCLTILAFKLPKEILDSFAIPIVSKIYDSDPSVRETAIECLITIAPRLSEKVLNAVVVYSKDKMSARELHVHIAATKILGLIISKHSQDKETMNFLIKHLKKKIHDPEVFIRKAAIESLTAIAFELSEETLNEFAAHLNINNDEWSVCHAAIECLTAIAPRLSSKTLDSFVIDLRNIMNTLNNDMRKPAIECLIVMAPKLSKEALNWLIPSLQNKFNRNYEPWERTIFCLIIDLLFHLLSCSKENRNELLISTINAVINHNQDSIYEFLIRLASKKELLDNYLELMPQLAKIDCIELDLMNYFLVNMHIPNKNVLISEIESSTSRCSL